MSSMTASFQSVFRRNNCQRPSTRSFTIRLSTPWGAAQTIKTLAPGILLVSTASHGGLMLDSAALQDLPEHLRTAGETYGDWRCFEEDCADVSNDSAFSAALPEWLLTAFRHE